LAINKQHLSIAINIPAQYPCTKVIAKLAGTENDLQHLWPPNYPRNAGLGAIFVML
jgi:hypothetical protein